MTAGKIHNNHFFKNWLGVNAATRWRSVTLSLPVERDSILDQSVSADQYQSTNGGIAIEGVIVLLSHFNCSVTSL